MLKLVLGSDESVSGDILYVISSLGVAVDLSVSVVAAGRRARIESTINRADNPVEGGSEYLISLS